MLSTKHYFESEVLGPWSVVFHVFTSWNLLSLLSSSLPGAHTHLCQHRVVPLTPPSGPGQVWGLSVSLGQVGCKQKSLDYEVSVVYCDQ